MKRKEIGMIRDEKEQISMIRDEKEKDWHD